MNYRLLLSVYLFCMIVCVACKSNGEDESIEIGKVWKFKYGYDTSYALATKNWDSISVDQFWEQQKNRNYDGYAWYETSVYIPRSLQKNGTVNDSLEIFLGPVDDCETTFLNGKVLGQNNVLSPCNTPVSKSLLQMTALGNLNEADRCYRLPLNDQRIAWDSNNKISILALDRGGLGGMNIKEKQYIRKVTPDDKLIMDLKYFYAPNNNFQVDTILDIENQTGRDMYGDLEVSVIKQKDAEQIYSLKKQVNLSKAGKDSTPISLPILLEPVWVKATFTLRDTKKVYRKEHYLSFIMAR